MTLLLYLACGIAASYQIVALLACLRHLLRRDPSPSSLPSISVLKPIRGLDPGLIAALSTVASQDYPEFEILCGVGDPADPALPALRRFAAQYPAGRVRVLVVPGVTTPNRKVGVLAGLEREARYPLVIASDSDIAVPRGYLRAVAAPLIEDPQTGLVTCIYRARSTTFWGRFEALGVATDFAPSALVAPFVGIREFGLGSTLALRAGDLRRLGGFAAVADYLADDYQVGRLVNRELHLRTWMSRVTVETSLDPQNWAAFWRHQVRWARTVRISRPDGYVGLPVTFAALWAVVALAAGRWDLAAGVAGIRLASALVAGIAVLRDPVTMRWWPLIPLRDLVSVAIWVAGLGGRTVIWGGERLEIVRGGRIVRG